MPLHTPTNSKPRNESREPRPATTRLLFPEGLEADENMALDEVLLDGEGWALRRTSWLSRAITIGRFQAYSDVDELKKKFRGPVPPPADEQPLAVIRRITGGGAIAHGRDLTLALAGPCPSPVFEERSPAAVAQRCARSLVAALLPFCEELQCRGGEDDERQQLNLADCFLRSSPSDLVVCQAGRVKKTGGLALHFRRDRVLIQVSIDLGEISLEKSQEESFLGGWAKALGAPAGVKRALTSQERQEMERVRGLRYRSERWNQSATVGA